MPQAGNVARAMKKFMEALRFSVLCLFLLYFTATLVLFIVSLIDLWRQ